MIKAVIFDCFGVVIGDALEMICAELRTHNPAGAEQIKGLIFSSNRGMMAPEESSRQIAQILDLSYEQYRQKIAEGEAKNHELMVYIRKLRKSYKTAMLSNIGSELRLSTRFAEGELTECFDVVVASGDIGYAKPEAQAYEITAERLGVRLDECVFTDDREWYCEAARGVGMQAILYKDLPQFRTDLEALLAT